MNNLGRSADMPDYYADNAKYSSLYNVSEGSAQAEFMYDETLSGTETLTARGKTTYAATSDFYNIYLWTRTLSESWSADMNS